MVIFTSIEIIVQISAVFIESLIFGCVVHSLQSVRLVYCTVQYRTCSLNQPGVSHIQVTRDLINRAILRESLNYIKIVVSLQK